MTALSHLTLVFVTTLTIGLVLQMWLYSRHGRYVAAHSNSVPIAFNSQVTLTDHQKAAAYTQAKVRLEQVDLIFRTIMVLLWTLGGGLEYIFNLWSQTGVPQLWSQWFAILTVFLIGMIVDLPLSWWRIFRLEQRFGFNHSTVSLFIKDTLLGLMLGLLLGGPLILAILWLMKQSGTWWWLYAWGLWTSFSLLIMWIYPTLINPLFNRFTPLEDGELRTRIEGLLARCGFSSGGVFMMDESKRSAHGNAYFTGMGHTKRIVLFDTLVTKLSMEELEAVLAHELGHYKHRHIQTRLLLNLVVTCAGFALLGWLTTKASFYHGLGVMHPSEGTALLLFLLVVPVFIQFLSPLGSWLMRYHEYQADAFAIAQASGKALISALVKLHKDNAGTLTPDPLFSAFHDSHPPAPLRVKHIEALLQ